MLSATSRKCQHFFKVSTNFLSNRVFGCQDRDRRHRSVFARDDAWQAGETRCPQRIAMRLRVQLDTCAYGDLNWHQLAADFKQSQATRLPLQKKEAADVACATLATLISARG
jgi:hypothetical protein